MASPPLIVVIAGPNGAGKSTTAPLLLRDALAVDEFVNADSIAIGLSAFQPETVAWQAAEVMLGRIHSLAEAGRSFAFETTLASRSPARWLNGLRQNAGYRVHIAFLSLRSADLAVARVAARVRDGGHDVPTRTIRRRFEAGLRNLFGLYHRAVDSWDLFDNSSAGELRLIASSRGGGEPRILDPHLWTELRRVAQ